MPEPVPSRPRGGALRTTGAAAAAQVITATAGYVVLYISALLLGRSGVGTLGVMISLTLLGQIVAGAGFGAYVTRQVARDAGRQEALVGRAIVLALITGLLAYLGITATVEAGLISATNVTAIRIASVAILPGAVAMVCEGLFLGRERMGLTAVSNAVEGFLRLLIAVPLLYLGFGIVGVAIALVAARTFGAGFDLWLMRNRLSLTPRVTLSEISQPLRAGLTLTGMFALAAVFLNADVIVLARLAGVGQAGLFVAAYRPVELAAFVPNSIFYGGGIHSSG